MKYYILLVAFLLSSSVAMAEQIQMNMGGYIISFYTPDRDEISSGYFPFEDTANDDFGFKYKSMIGILPTISGWSIGNGATDNRIEIYSLSNTISVSNTSIPMTMLYNKIIDNHTGFVGFKTIEGYNSDGERLKVPKLVAWYPIDDLGTETQEIVMITSGMECCEDTFNKIIDTIHVEKCMCQ